ncbi:MAG: hypothetical protein QOH97_2179 [Actinoplanes sp.]|nr:hypothetical protein [Actinoplanes sp.]
MGFTKIPSRSLATPSRNPINPVDSCAVPGSRKII